MLHFPGWRHLPRPLQLAIYWSPLAITLSQMISINHIKGRSMQPTLNPDSSPWKDIAVFDRLSVYIGRPCQRGDIVVVKSPSDPKRMLVKRIIALQGDVVKTRPPCQESEVSIPQGHIWIEGDEPFHTEDSNLFGPVPLGLVDAKLAFLIWPIVRFGRLDQSIPEDRTTPAYRLAMDRIQRGQIRHSRVTPLGRIESVSTLSK
ncbi:peptidase S24/S26A/S26B/S26C [Amanita rubescens]|nr:peptidase S24/S26A/S26B/S26C [Amanita rubescens]